MRITLILWTFGYALVTLSGVLGGLATLGQELVLNIPLATLGIALSMVINAWMRRLPDRQRWRDIPWLLLAGTFAAAIITVIEHFYIRFLGTYLFQWSLPRNWQHNREVMIFILYLWSLYLQIALLWATRKGEVAAQLQADVLSNRIAASRAEAAALRLQLNPHFVFNTLNGVTSLVVQRENERAEEMIARLAQFLRSSLSADPEKPVDLATEIDIALSYLYVEQARFGDRLRVEQDIDPAVLGLEVPNFCLQPLVENAVKYGVTRCAGPAIIAITARRAGRTCVIEVTNRQAMLGQDQALDVAPPGLGIGLRNTRRRLAELFGRELSMEANPLPDGFRVTIGIPCELTDAAA